uniref:helix-turn-helix domain-containing protein n=1 Tax=Olsenella uli TaxID=133926 RepID=UPI0028EB73A3|nr:helix-turn-helix transcriptional regulator [Olsenella uli]
MGVGERIRRCRKAGGYTQRGLAEEVGVTESAIRNYELGLRMPGESQLEAIAKALDVAPESLADVGPESARGVLEMVFRLEGEMGLRPVETEDGTGIAVDPEAEDSQKLSQALKAWKRMREQLEAGKVSEEEYEAWKASFRG